MGSISVLIVDESDEFRATVREYLDEQSSIEVIGDCCDGCEAVKILNASRVDVVILDLVIPKIDGYALIEEISRNRPGTQIIVVSTLYRNDLVLRAINAGARYYMVKPIDKAILAERIKDCFVYPLEGTVSDVSVSQQDSQDLDDVLTSLFLAIGIPASIKGYTYLKDAVRIAACEPGVSMTMDLYPRVAEMHGETDSRVERAIRHAVEVAWNRGRIECLNTMFGYKVVTPYDKLPNREFIALVVEYVTEKMKKMGFSVRR